MSRTIIATGLVTASLLIPGAAGVSSASSPNATPSMQQAARPGGQPKAQYNRWKWFRNTYWIVPKRGIYSVVHSGTNPRRFVVTRGQTVFHITDYFNGYWTGAVVVKITRAQVPSCQYVLGQVTPQGRVYMTMYNADSGAMTNEPLGEMVRTPRGWTMVNTMTSPTSGGGTMSHWAYMVQSRKGERTFRHLPFANRSIPEFMSACPKGPHIVNPNR